MLIHFRSSTGKPSTFNRFLLITLAAICFKERYRPENKRPNLDLLFSFESRFSLPAILNFLTFHFSSFFFKFVNIRWGGGEWFTLFFYRPMRSVRKMFGFMRISSKHVALCRLRAKSGAPTSSNDLTTACLSMELVSSSTCNGVFPAKCASVFISLSRIIHPP